MSLVQGNPPPHVGGYEGAGSWRASTPVLDTPHDPELPRSGASADRRHPVEREVCSALSRRRYEGTVQGNASRVRSVRAFMRAFMALP